MSQNRIDRKHFLSICGKVALGGLMLPSSTNLLANNILFDQQDELFFKISLAQWSLHRSFQSGKRDPRDFAKIAATEFDIKAVEYVNQFYMDKVADKPYLTDLKKVSEDNGVKNLVLMVDGEGPLASIDEGERKQAVENHKKWIGWAEELGCHSVRVNLWGEGAMLEMKEAAIKSLNALADYSLNSQIYIVVENHGGYSSNARWLSGVIRATKRANCGTLPDFGNFKISDTRMYDRYNGVRELMPYAQAVSAKSFEFDDAGEEVNIDYERMIEIVKNSGYIGYVGIEYEGEDPDEDKGIRLTKNLLEKIGASFN